MSVLIITHTEDNESVARVAEAIARKGATRSALTQTAIRPTCVSRLYYDGSGERLTLTNEEGEFDLREVDSIWYRRLNLGARLPVNTSLWNSTPAANSSGSNRLQASPSPTQSQTFFSSTRSTRYQGQGPKYPRQLRPFRAGNF